MRAKSGYIWPGEEDNSLQAPAGFSLGGSQWSLVGPDEKIENVRRRRGLVLIRLVYYGSDINNMLLRS